jgi:hypothetical protein
MLGDDLAAMRAMSADEILTRTNQFVPKVRGLTTARVLRPDPRRVGNRSAGARRLPERSFRGAARRGR